MAKEKFDIREVEMIDGIITFGADRQKELPGRVLDAAHSQIRAAQPAGRCRVVRLESLRRPPMFNCCFGLAIFPEKSGEDVMRRRRLRIVARQLTVDLFDA